MGKTISIKVLFGIYFLLMAGKVFAFSCNVDGGSSIGAGTTSVYVNLDPVIQPGQNLVVDLSQHISCWNDYGGWYDTDHINLVQGSAFAGSLQSYKGSLYWNNVTYPFPLTTNTNVLDIGDKTPMPLPLKLYITPVGAAGGVVIKAGEVIARILFKNRERVPAKGYISDQLTDEAIGVVDRAKTLDQPFMLYLAYNAPHLPNDNPAPDQYQKQFNTGSQTADNYYASVYSVDQGVKRILEQLKKNGQYDNTIILFTSDNGAVIDGPLPLNGAQKGYKSQTYPGGTHTPMFMWWKGKLQPGNYDKLISAMDFYPTALDAADISIPKDLKLDGVSLLPWLQDKKQGEPHKNLTWITSYSHWFDEENIPFWDNYHKFVRHQSDDYPHNPNTEDLSQFSYTVRNNDYSLVYTVENNQLGLYKLTDLQQKDNLAAANPQVVKEMQGVVREFIDSSQPPLSEVNQEKFNNIKKALSEAK